jgi:predicted transglutaminase-like cysteine proteinase
MNRFAKLGLAATALTFSALAAAPASAADIVVKLGGKSPEQISVELEKAASSVCRDELLKATLVNLTDCIEFVFNDAVAQLPPTIVIPKK